MARTRTRSTIEDKIEAQKLIVSKAKDKYETAVNELERLMKLRDEEHRKELLKHIAASKRSYVLTSWIFIPQSRGIRVKRRKNRIKSRDFRHFRCIYGICEV